MKKHKNNRRSQRRAPGPKKIPAPAGARRARLGWIGWLAGAAGLLALAGLFAFQKSRVPSGSGSILAGGTNKADVPSHPPSPITNAGGPSPVVDGGTNRPGAALNREGEGRAADLNNQGTRLLDAGNGKGAIPLFQQALALAPNDETFHFNLGHAYTWAGDLTNAEQEYREALRLLPDYPEAHNNYGNLLVRLGRFDEAEKHLTEAVEQMPESADFQNNLGVLRQRLRQTNEALLCFQKAIECDSNYWQAHFNLAQASFARKNLVKGIAELRETLRIKPGFEPAQSDLARATGQMSSNAPSKTSGP